MKAMLCGGNNLKALHFQGDVSSLVPRLHGVTLDGLSKLLGINCKCDGDQLWIQRSSVRADKVHLLAWLVDSARRLYQAPVADEETVRLRQEHGDPLGMAHRFLRRYCCSAMTVSTIAGLLADLSHEELLEGFRQVTRAAPHSALRLAQCLPLRRTWRLWRFPVCRSQLPSGAYRSQVVLLWVKGHCKLRPQEPTWQHLRRSSQITFLKAGTWGHLKWAMESKDVQIIDGFHLHLSSKGSEELLVTFALDSEDLRGSAFLLSVIDNHVVSGPHLQEKLEAVEFDEENEEITCEKSAERAFRCFSIGFWRAFWQPGRLKASDQHGSTSGSRPWTGWPGDPKWLYRVDIVDLP